MTRIERWQDIAVALVGAWLAASPWALGFDDDGSAMANAVLLGLALIGVALGAILAPRAWEAWAQAAMGLWLVASPWLLGYAGQQTAMRNAVITGLAVMVLATWALLRSGDRAVWRQNRPAH